MAARFVSLAVLALACFSVASVESGVVAPVAAALPSAALVNYASSYQSNVVNHAYSAPAVVQQFVPAAAPIVQAPVAAAPVAPVVEPAATPVEEPLPIVEDVARAAPVATARLTSRNNVQAAAVTAPIFANTPLLRSAALVKSAAVVNSAPLALASDAYTQSAYSRLLQGYTSLNLPYTVQAAAPLVSASAPVAVAPAPAPAVVDARFAKLAAPVRAPLLKSALPLVSAPLTTAPLIANPSAPIVNARLSAAIPYPTYYI